MTLTEAFSSLAVAVAAGALVGAERQQAHARRPEVEFGGIRTFPLLALLGAIGALLRPVLGVWVIVALLVAVVVSMAISQARAQSDEIGVTSEVAAIVTFGLGVISGTPELLPGDQRFLLVAAIAATTMALLALKRPLHAFSSKVSSDDVQATVKFVILALVVIPLLPNRTFGPLDVLNPRKIGLMTALVAGVSFAGYVASRAIGNRRGMLVTGVVGGLVSSTALTLALSGRAKAEPALVRLCAIAIVAACATMFARILFVVGVVHPPLLLPLLLPLGSMALAGYLIAIQQYRARQSERAGEDVSFRNPFELRQALSFGLAFGVIQLAAKAAEHYVGASGLYASAVLAGLTDVDAITLSLAELHRSGTNTSVAVPGIALAAVTNTVVKAGIAAVIGGAPLGKRVAPWLLGVLLVGGAGVLGTHWLVHD